VVQSAKSDTIVELTPMQVESKPAAVSVAIETSQPPPHSSVSVPEPVRVTESVSAQHSSCLSWSRTLLWLPVLVFRGIWLTLQLAPLGMTRIFDTASIPPLWLLAGLAALLPLAVIAFSIYAPLQLLPSATSSSAGWYLLILFGVLAIVCLGLSVVSPALKRSAGVGPAPAASARWDLVGMVTVFVACFQCVQWLALASFGQPYSSSFWSLNKLSYFMLEFDSAAALSIQSLSGAASPFAALMNVSTIALWAACGAVALFLALFAQSLRTHVDARFDVPLPSADAPARFSQRAPENDESFAEALAQNGEPLSDDVGDEFGLGELAAFTPSQINAWQTVSQWTSNVGSKLSSNAPDYQAYQAIQTALPALQHSAPLSTLSVSVRRRRAVLTLLLGCLPLVIVCIFARMASCAYSVPTANGDFQPVSDSWLLAALPAGVSSTTQSWWKSSGVDIALAIDPTALISISSTAQCWHGGHTALGVIALLVCVFFVMALFSFAPLLWAPLPVSHVEAARLKSAAALVTALTVAPADASTVPTLIAVLKSSPAPLEQSALIRLCPRIASLELYLGVGLAILHPLSAHNRMVSAATYVAACGVLLLVHLYSLFQNSLSSVLSFALFKTFLVSLCTWSGICTLLSVLASTPESMPAPTYSLMALIGWGVLLVIFGLLLALSNTLRACMSERYREESEASAIAMAQSVQPESVPAASVDQVVVVVQPEAIQLSEKETPKVSVQSEKPAESKSKSKTQPQVTAPAFDMPPPPPPVEEPAPSNTKQDAGKKEVVVSKPVVVSQPEPSPVAAPKETSPQKQPAVSAAPASVPVTVATMAAATPSPVPAQPVSVAVKQAEPEKVSQAPTKPAEVVKTAEPVATVPKTESKAGSPTHDKNQKGPPPFPAVEKDPEDSGDDETGKMDLDLISLLGSESAKPNRKAGSWQRPSFVPVRGCLRYYLVIYRDFQNIILGCLFAQKLNLNQAIYVQQMALAASTHVPHAPGGTKAKAGGAPGSLQKAPSTSSLSAAASTTGPKAMQRAASSSALPVTAGTSSTASKPLAIDTSAPTAAQASVASPSAAVVLSPSNAEPTRPGRTPLPRLDRRDSRDPSPQVPCFRRFCLTSFCALIR
jgi:hypothetical protein